MAPLALQQVSCNAVLISGGRAVKASRRSSALDLFTIVRLAPEAPRCGAAVGACCINPPLIPRSAPSISHRDRAQHVVAGGGQVSIGAGGALIAVEAAELRATDPEKFGFVATN
jgi:hypothetical protein